MPHDLDPAPLLVFDLDGTLADTAGDLISTLNVILHREGLKGLALSEARPLVGGGARALIERGLAAQGVTASSARLDTLFADFLVHYEAHIADETVLFDGVIEALDRFEAAGWIFAVCTNKIEYPAVLLLRALGIANRFTAICGKDSFAVNKPDGRALLQTIARAGGSPGRTIMVGDTKTDIDTARNAQVPAVGVTFGYAADPIASYKPDRIIGHYDELWEAVAALHAV
jgi:phosphoglycolate phosphatase